VQVLKDLLVLLVHKALLVLLVLLVQPVLLALKALLALKVLLVQPGKQPQQRSPVRSVIMTLL